MLFTPDSYDFDWYGWVTNQSGHFVLGMVIAFVTCRVWPALVVALAFEIIQWSADVVDSVTDVLFTIAGAVFYTTASKSVMLAFIPAIAFGFIQRYRRGKG